MSTGESLTTTLNPSQTTVPNSSTQSSLGPPQRTRSWGRRRNSQVVVLVTSNDNLYLADQDLVDQCPSKPLKTIDLPRTPWANTTDVYLPDEHKHSKSGDEQYVGTARLNRMGRGMTWKRVTGSVTRMYVYDRPPRTGRKVVA
ncbi:MAG: hypothetical protein M1820_007520 [Bogoriella megaspora]|nr:MAG: hypothetical protein M1820_007520 [Bogoriella megaspora]